MHILMLSTYPFPTNNGARRRILALAHHLCQHHDVTLASLLEKDPSTTLMNGKYEVHWRDRVVDLPHRSRWRTALRACLSSCSYGQVKYQSRKFQSTIGELLENERFDVILVITLNLATYLKPCLDGSRPRSLFVLDQQNVDELYYASFLKNTSIVLKTYAALEVVKARRLQKRWFPRFDAILCVSSEDLDKTRQYVDERTCLWLAPNGVDIEYFEPVAQDNLRDRVPTVVFGGSLDVLMNQDAVHWFVSCILPCLKQRVPNVQFWIVGRSPPESVRSLADREEIKVTGTVPDVREYYRQADVFVVPLRFGGGTKLKTLEAMAMGLPVISTTVGAQGLGVESGRHLYVADNPEVFASHVIELLEDRDIAVEMGAEARRLVEQQYTWTSIVGKVDGKVADLVQRRLG